MDITNKKVCFLGDSITKGSGASSIEFSYVSVFESLTNSICKNFGVSGTRYAEQVNEFNEDYNETFLRRAKRMDRDADFVVVFGGTNDFGHGDSEFGKESDIDLYTFTGATNMLYKYLKENFKNAHIIVVTPSHRTSENNNEINDIGLKQKKKFRDIVNYEILKAKEFGFGMIDLSSDNELDATDEKKNIEYFVDGLHPNNKGHKYIAEKIKEYFDKL